MISVILFREHHGVFGGRVCHHWLKTRILSFVFLEYFSYGLCSSNLITVKSVFFWEDIKPLVRKDVLFKRLNTLLLLKPLKSLCEETHLLRSNKWLHPTGEGWERLQTKRKILVCEQSKREIEANFHKQRTMNKFWVPMSPKVCGWIFHSHTGFFSCPVPVTGEKSPSQGKTLWHYSPCDGLPAVYNASYYVLYYEST